MLIKDCSVDKLHHLARTTGITYRTGPFVINLKTSAEIIITELKRVYGDTPVYLEPQFTHYHIEIKPPGNLRRFLRKQVVFQVDGVTPFEPYPADQAFPLLEWGLNWCIASTSHNWLLLHSAAVERDGKAVIFPALPGSGKSTLCSGLINRGWRLLSDEFGIVQQSPLAVVPLPRSIPLKNVSIGVIKTFASAASIGRTYPKTRKGDIAHLAPAPQAIQQQSTHAEPRLIVFPTYQPGAETTITPLEKSAAFIRLSNNSFNYHAIMENGYNSLYQLVSHCDCYTLNYSDLEDVTTRLTDLISSESPAP